MDAEKISQIASMMEACGLSRVRLEEADGTSVELERARPEVQVVAAQPQAAVPAAAAPVSQPAEAAAAPAETAGPVPAADDALDMTKSHAVTSPMVGVFYEAPSPGAEPFVRVGQKVSKGQTLCVIEAMKVMNEVVAEVDGEVIDVCVKDGELVEYGCCLMKIY